MKTLVLLKIGHLSTWSLAKKQSLRTYWPWRYNESWFPLAWGLRRPPRSTIARGTPLKPSLPLLLKFIILVLPHFHHPSGINHSRVGGVSLHLRPHCGYKEKWSPKINCLIFSLSFDPKWRAHRDNRINLVSYLSTDMDPYLRSSNSLALAICMLLGMN